MAQQAVLLLAHGTPETLDQIPEYLRNVVSGRPVPHALIEEIRHRYSLIGKSPLTEITMAQARLVEREMAAAGLSVPVYVGMRNWRPYIPDVVRQMLADGVGQAAVICMAPQNSRTSVGLYRRAVEAEGAGLRIDFTEGWAQHPLLADAFAERLRPVWSKLSSEAGAPVPVLFTAHSVPARTVEAPGAQDPQGPRLWPGQGADPYADEARHTAELVAARVPEIPRWWFAFQSQGASGGPWIGPKVEETLEEIAAEGFRNVLLQPIGFLCDHIEILFDVDIAFKEYASKLNVRLERPESLNGSHTLARAVADLAVAGLNRLNR
jgi:protoporphyrin/coproporphyrin ferrochelatase